MNIDQLKERMEAAKANADTLMEHVMGDDSTEEDINAYFVALGGYLALNGLYTDVCTAEMYAKTERHE